MSDLISRQSVTDICKARCEVCGEYKKYNGAMCGACYLDGVAEDIECLPSAQTEKQWELKAVFALDVFTKTFCRDYTVLDDLEFRCNECEFHADNDKCLAKVMARRLCPNYKDFGSMGDL